MAQRARGGDRGRGAADHPLGFEADRVHLPVCTSEATTEGSDTTIPRPLTYTSVLAVPRSIAMSRTPKLVVDGDATLSAGCFSTKTDSWKGFR